MRRFYRALVLLAVAGCLTATTVACGGDDGSDNGSKQKDTQTDDPEDTLEDVDAGQGDSTQEVSDNDTQIDDSSGDTADSAETSETANNDNSNNGGSKEPLITLIYEKQSLDVNGWELNLSVPQIVNITNGSRYGQNLTEEDAETVRSEIFTDELISGLKAEDGFDCGEKERIEDVRHTFEGQVLVDGSYERRVKLITGCIPETSEKPDAELVKSIITKGNELKRDYFTDQ